MRLFLQTTMLIVALSNTALAVENFFNVEKGRVTLYSNSTELKDGLYKKIMTATEKVKFEDLTADKELRPLILKALKLNETDSVFLKMIGQNKSLSFKVSDLKLIVVTNKFGVSESIGNIVLELPKVDKLSFASIGKTNPFNDTGVFSEIQEKNKTFTISPKVTLLEQAIQTDAQKEREEEQELKVGQYKLLVQVDKGAPILAKTMDLDSDSYIHEFNVVGGEVLSNGATLIMVSGQSSCGFYIIVKDKEVKTSSAPCGAMGC